MVHNCWAFVRGIWLMVTIDTGPSLLIRSKNARTRTSLSLVLHFINTVTQIRAGGVERALRRTLERARERTFHPLAADWRKYVTVFMKQCTKDQSEELPASHHEGPNDGGMLLNIANYSDTSATLSDVATLARIGSPHPKRAREGAGG